MDILHADFVSSFTRQSDCPADQRPEFAFIGRSNVGKSSLINMLTGRKGLAKVSGTPGKTQLINFFLINREWYLVDLPGYGYARVSKSKHKELGAMVKGYLLSRTAMYLAFVLVDSNVPPSKTDLDFINMLGENSVPFAIVFTKTDRLKPGAIEQNIQAFLQKLSETWETLPTYFISSSEYRTGRQELLDFIAQTIRSVK